MAVMFNPPHPGVFLKSALKALNLSARQFAAHIGVSPASVTRLMNEETTVSPEMAVRLAQAISGPDAATWLRMQAEYDAWHASQNLDVSFITRLRADGPTSTSLSA